MTLCEHRSNAVGTRGHFGRRVRRTTAAAGFVASVALALGGCGGSGGAGSSSGSTPGASSGGTSYAAQTATSNKLAEFSQCMRAHGLADFPDPVNGHLNLMVRKGSD